MTRSLRVVVDSRTRVLAEDLETSEVKALTDLFVHQNTKFHQLERMGYSTRGVPRAISTWEERDGNLELPRGGYVKLRAFAQERGIKLLTRDDRTDGELGRAEWPALRVKPRDYQSEFVDAVLERECGILRAPTGSGKTLATIMAAHAAGLPTLVAVWESGLFDQWLQVIERSLGWSGREVGIVRAKEKRLRQITIAMLQTLTRLDRDDPIFSAFGFVAIDEIQRGAAPSTCRAIDPFRARYRIGVSADERRKDRMEGITHDLCGDVIFDLGSEKLEKEGSVLPVDFLVYPTEFDAPWYEPLDGDYNRLLAELGADPERNALAAQIAVDASRGGSVFVMVRRHEHGLRLEQMITSLGVRCGLMFGSPEYATVYDRTREELEAGRLKIAIGTIQSIGQGIDVPRVHDVVLAAPSASNRQLVGQARGRACRPWGGEKSGRVHYLLDRFAGTQGHLANLDKWFPLQVWVVNEHGKRVAAAIYRKEHRARDRTGDGIFG